MRKLTLGTRLTLGGIIIVVAPLLIIGLLSVMKASDALTELSGEQAAHVADKLADMTGVALSEEMKLAKELSLEKITTETAAKVARGQAGRFCNGYRQTKSTPVRCYEADWQSV